MTAAVPRSTEPTPRGRPVGAGDSAFMVVRAWRDGPPPADVRARVWGAAGGVGDVPLSERLASSVDELEEIIAEWLAVLHRDDWGPDRPGPAR